MKVAVFGTGMVGRALAGRLDELGHDVVVGTRDPAGTLSRSEAAGWLAAHAGVELAAYADAARDAEVVVNATSGDGSLAALEAAGSAALAGKVLLDVANPLDFSQGMPPILSVASTDSLAEQIQRAFPDARVVKTLNTMRADVMIEPGRVPGEHNVFVAGDDPGAKETAVGLLREIGWPSERIIDLGGIRSARGMEMYLPLWLSLWSALGTPFINIAVVQE